MDYPRYLVNIHFQPKYVAGQTTSYIGGVTYSIPAYAGNYYVASMPEVGIFATGSAYDTALSALLILATASTTPNQVLPPIDSKNTW